MHRVQAQSIVVSLLLCLASAQAELENAFGGSEKPVDADTHAFLQKTANLTHHHHIGNEDGLFEFGLSTGIDSRYVSEGRDNLPGEGGVYWGRAIGHTHAVGGTVFAEVLGIEAWETSYNEINLSAGYEYEVGSLLLGAALSYLDFSAVGETDFEASLSAQWKLGAASGLTTEWVWSEDTGGWFGETSAFCGVVVNQNLTFNAAVFIGANGGYVAEEHDGLNYLGVRIEAVRSITEHLQGEIYVAGIEPLNKQQGESLRDLLWVGGALTVAF